MDKVVLVLNAGSSSLRFAVYPLDGAARAPGPLYRGRIEGIGGQARLIVAGGDTAGGAEPAREIPGVTTQEKALAAALDWLDARASGLDIAAAGHRVVHGGLHFCAPALVDDGVLEQLATLIPLAPLHQPHNLAAIRALRRMAPGMTQVACFDTAFHRTMPAVAQHYALPRALTAAGLCRYGFHGLSYEHIASVLPEHLASAADSRVIAAHLGHGASMCALAGLRGIATTMGFTPLDGLPMATRCGSIDPGLVLHLVRDRGMAADAVADLLARQSGLAGVSGLSGDMRELLASGESQAAEAVDLFVHRAARELGALAADLGGLDSLVFTGGIGENSPIIRARICRKAAWLGVRLDAAANDAGGPCVSAPDSAVSVWVIPADEERVIAQHVRQIVAPAHPVSGETHT